MKYFQAFLAIALVAILAIPGIVQAQTEERPAEPAKPSNSRYVVPSHTLIPLTLKDAINSRTAFVGQAIYCETIYPITVGNRIVIPVGSYVKGAVTEVIKPGRIKGKAQIGVRFESITLPNGTNRPLRATLASYSGSGEKISSAKREGSRGNQPKVRTPERSQQPRLRAQSSVGLRAGVVRAPRSAL